MAGKEQSLSPEIIKLTEKIARDLTSRLFVPLAEEYMKCGMVDEALMVLTDGLKVHPHYIGAHVSLGKVYLEKGMKGEARGEFEQVVRANPENILAHRHLVRLYRDEDQWQNALRSCRLILSFNPKDHEMQKMLEELEAAISTQEQRGAIQQESGGVNQGQVELSKADEVSRGRAQVREGMSNAVPQNEAPLQESAVVAASMEIRLSEEISPPQEASVLQAPGTAQEAPPAGMERITPVEKVSEEKKMEKTRSPLEEPEPSDSAEDAPVERPEGEIFAGDLVALQSSVGDSLDPGFTESTVALDLSAIEKAVERQVGDVKLSETQEVPVIEVPEETGDELASLEEVLSFSSEFESLSADYPKTPEGGIEKVTASSGAEVEPLAEVSGQRDSTGRVEATLQSETLSEPEMGPPQRDDFATESLAELYVKQGYYNKGIEIYKSLLKADPENRAIRQKLEDAVTLANLLIGRNEQEMTAQDSHSFLNPEAWGLTQDRERGGPEEQPQGRPPLREVQADKLASSKEDAKLVKIQRLQVWLENIKKGQQS